MKKYDTKQQAVAASPAQNDRGDAVQTYLSKLGRVPLLTREGEVELATRIDDARPRLIVSAEDVDSVKDSAVSLMPDGQLDALSKEQVRDLIAYLMGKGQVPLPAIGKR